MSAESDRLWCRGLMSTLAEGGVWGVPRSGLVFSKRGDQLVLTARMPWSEIAEAAADPALDLPRSEAALEEFQELDFVTIRRKFAEAGIVVRRGLTDEEV